MNTKPNCKANKGCLLTQVSRPFRLISLLVLLCLGPAISQAISEASKGNSVEATEEEKPEQVTDGESESTELAQAPAEKSAVNQGRAVLKEVSAHQSKDELRFDFAFDRPVSINNLPFQFIRQTIQLDLPNVILARNKKKLVQVNGEEISKIVVFAQGSDRVRSQIVLKSGLQAKKFEPLIHVEKDRSILRIKIERKESSRETKEETRDEAATTLVVRPTGLGGEPTPSLEDQLKASLPSQASVESADKNADKNADTKEPKLAPESEIPLASAPVNRPAESSWRKMALAVAIVLGLGAATLIALRRYTRTNTSKVEATKIKIVSQHHLGPKKSLALVRVAGESMLIGVTDNNISLIKSLSLLDEELPEYVPGHFDTTLGSLQHPARSVHPAQLSERETDDLAESVTDKFTIRGLGEIKNLVSQNLRLKEFQG